MRITFILPFASLAGGIRVVATYARKLLERGHDVVVVSTPPPNPSLRGRLMLAFGGSFTTPIHYKTPLLDFLGDRHIVTTTPKPVTAKDVPDGDVIIATWWETAEWVAPLPASKGRKFYLIQDYELEPGRPNHRIAATYALGMRKMAVSEYVRTTIRQNHDPRADIAITPNGVDLEQFSSAPRSKNAVLTVGFLHSAVPRKNTPLALEALLLARRDNPNLRVVTFGRDAIDADMPLPDWFEFRLRPSQDLIPRLYAACDLWLFPTAREGFGLPILEAMACRTPVLATDAGAAPDLINGRNGLLLPHEAGAFAEAMSRFGRMEPAEWATWSEAAFRTAAQNTWDEATDRLLAVLTA